MSAGLLLVFSLDIGFAANRLPVGHLGRFQDHLGVVPLLHLGDDHFNMLLAGARDQEFLGLGIAEEAQHGVFFHQLVDAGPQLVLVGAALGLDGKRDRGLRQFHSRIKNRSRLVAQRVAGQRVFQFGHGSNIARMQFGHRHGSLALHDGNMRHLFL